MCGSHIKLLSQKRSHLLRLRNISSAAIVPASLRSIQEYEIQCKTVKQLENLGGIIASKSIKGDVYLLTGSVGVGKTCFARGFVRRLAGDKLLSVTSPTFLLDNTYEIVNKDYIVHHMDLYRIPDMADVSILGIPEIYSTSISLIEWPERLGKLWPSRFVEIHIRSDTQDDKSRFVTITPVGKSKKFKLRIDSVLNSKTFWTKYSLSVAGHAAGIR